MNTSAARSSAAHLLRTGQIALSVFAVWVGLVPLSPLRALYRDLAVASAMLESDGVDVLGLAVELDLPEMGASGTAFVTDLRCDPTVESAAGRTGTGRVVTAKFSHPPSRQVLDVRWQGESQPIGVTDNHRFWSVDRHEFLPIGQLDVGERVQTFHGDTKRIEQKLPRPGPQIVYNLEVYGEHVYFVGEQGVLAHNTCGGRRVAGETTSTTLGKLAHKRSAEARRASGQFDIVESVIRDLSGNPIRVPGRIDLTTGLPRSGTSLQKARPDAVSFSRRLIVDDKPLGRPLAKDRQEIIRFIEAFRIREGHVPNMIGIQRYDPASGLPVRTDLHSPSEFLP